MPTQQPPNRPNSSADRQIFESNNTLNHLLGGGTRRSWMASAPPGYPTPRPPKRPRLQQQDNSHPIQSQSPSQAQQQQQTHPQLPPKPPAPIQHVLPSNAHPRLQQQDNSHPIQSQSPSQAQQQQQQQQQTHPQLPPEPQAPIQHVLPSNTHLDVYKPATGPRQSVLPSPAPSDEPSPAVSTSHESPHTTPASLPDPPPMNNQFSSAPNVPHSPHPVTESRFIVGSALEHSNRAVAGQGGGQADGRAESATLAQLSTDSVSGQNGAVLASGGPFELPSLRPSGDGQVMVSAQGRGGGGGGQRGLTTSGDALAQTEGPSAVGTQQPATSRADHPQSTVMFPSMLVASPRPAQPPVPNTEPSANRQRPNNGSGGSSQVDIAAQAGVIDTYMASQGGPDAFTKDAEQPRFQLLSRACTHGDTHFVALHQLHCMWSRRREDVYAILGNDCKVIDAGFHVVELVLKSNDLIHPRHRDWMADFPHRLSLILQAYQRHRQCTKYVEAVYDAGNFLARAAVSYGSLAMAMENRGYPYLVDELLGQLGCRSITLQHALFTASRRRLLVADGHFGRILDQAFFQDQRQHQDQSGAFLHMDPIPDPRELERRNSRLINHYKTIVQEALRSRQEEQTRRSQISPAVSSPLPQQQSSTPNQILTSNAQVRQPSISGNQPNCAASSPAAASPHLPPTGVPSHNTPNPASFPANHPFAPVPSQQSAGPPRQNMVLPNSSGPPQRDAPPRLAPQGQPNPRQQPAIQSWMPTGNMANQRIPGQSSPGPHGNQAPFSSRQAGQQVMPQIQAQYNALMEQQQQQFIATSENQRLMNGNQQALSNPAMNQHYPPLQTMYQQQARPQQPQLSQHQNVAQPQTQHHSHRLRGQNPQAPNQALQYSQGTRQPSSVRTAIPTPGVSPVAAQFPGGIRGQLQQPLVSPQPVQSVISPGISTPDAPFQVAMANAMQQLQQQQRQQMAQGAGYPRFIPPPNYVIPLCDFPTGPEDRKSIMMSLHQAEVRSPRRKVRAPATGSEGNERYYQAVMSLAVPPARVPPAKVLHKFYFEVSDEELSRASQIITQGDTLPVATHFDGSLRWRVRTTKLKPKKKFDDVHEWSCADMDWPLHITLNLNGNNIQIRRKPHNGRDQPAELTPFITTGRNELLVAVAVTKDPPADQFALAVEIVETRSHASIMDYIWTRGVIPEEDTLNKIKRRVTGTRLDDDSIVIVQPDLSIDVADPFTRAMWQIPVRGATCTHMECFDLSIWLETRPSKTVRCPHSSFTKCGCDDQREPSVVDKWKCPICEGDARPYSLKIDGFLLKVRQELERAGKLKAKRIQAAPDGTWRAEVEEDSDDDDDSDGDGARQKSASKGPAVPKKPVEVIDLLDD